MTDEEHAHYSAALDEIWRLRALMATEARVTEAHLELKSFPKSRRKYAEEAVERQRRCALGESQAVYDEFGTPYRRAQSEMRSIGATDGLTRSSWESERKQA